jgi:hypothetical protein
MAQSPFDPTRYRWRKVTGDAGSPYAIHHDYAILGHDRAAGTLDMLVRWYGDGGHCPIHRHAATTTVLVLEGEQHLWDVHPDGSRGAHRVRRAGDYALSTGDIHPHLERGGEQGGVAFFGCHTTDGLLYELTDENAKVFLDVTIDWLVKDFEENAEK